MSTDPLSATFSALADPTRRAIIARLAAGGEASVTELAEPFAMSLPAVSKHLKVLERAGLVSRGREAQWRPRRLDGAALREAARWLEDYRRFWDESLDRLDAYLRESKDEERSATAASEPGREEGEVSMATGAAGDEAEIRALVEGVEKALRDRDADALAARLAPDVLVYDLAPPLRSHGAEAERDKARAWLATKKGPIAYEVRDLRIEVGGAVAFSTGLARMRATGVDGDEADLWLRTTVCYRKSGGRWEIAHQHESVPFHMDGSLRAAVDLAPEG